MRKTLALAAGCVVALSAGAGVAAASVSAADVQQWISAQLSAGTVAPPDSVMCPGDLDAVVGATISCAVTRGDETRGVTVTVETLDNGVPGLSLAPARQ
ncbi:MAG: DUF4333 domain-containing protein [Mycobacterium sp.]